jgi:hypothetical protein
MTEASVLPFPRRVGTQLPIRRGTHTSAPTGLELTAPASPIRETLRAENRDRATSVDERRCECGRPNCRDTFPSIAEAYRGMAERFIVVPDHVGAGTVIAAADRFFVVEPNRHRDRYPTATHPGAA